MLSPIQKRMNDFWFEIKEPGKEPKVFSSSPEPEESKPGLGGRMDDFDFVVVSKS